MKYKEIYLVSFPFSDLKGSKVRPALIVSRDSFNETSRDVIVCALSGSKSRFCNKVLSSDLVDGTLHKECFVKAHSIAKLQKDLLQKRIGSISESLAMQVKKTIVNLL